MAGNCCRRIADLLSRRLAVTSQTSLMTHLCVHDTRLCGHANRHTRGVCCVYLIHHASLPEGKGHAGAHVDIGLFRVHFYLFVTGLTVSSQIFIAGSGLKHI